MSLHFAIGHEVQGRLSRTFMHFPHQRRTDELDACPELCSRGGLDAAGPGIDDARPAIERSAAGDRDSDTPGRQVPSLDSVT